MAILDDAVFDMGAVDYSAQVRELSIPQGTEGQDPTTFTVTARLVAAGLRTGSATISYNEGGTLGTALATLQATSARTAVVVIKADSGATSTTNPAFTFTGVLMTYEPVGGSVGDQRIGSATFELASAIVITTTP